MREPYRWYALWQAVMPKPSARQASRVAWPSQTPKTHHLRFHMSKLRHKLEPEPSRPRQLITEPGTGYRFQP